MLTNICGICLRRFPNTWTKRTRLFSITFFRGQTPFPIFATDLFRKRRRGTDSPASLFDRTAYLPLTFNFRYAMIQARNIKSGGRQGPQFPVALRRVYRVLNALEFLRLQTAGLLYPYVCFVRNRVKLLKSFSFVDWGK